MPGGQPVQRPGGHEEPAGHAQQRQGRIGQVLLDKGLDLPELGAVGLGHARAVGSGTSRAKTQRCPFWNVPARTSRPTSASAASNSSTCSNHSGKLRCVEPRERENTTAAADTEWRDDQFPGLKGN
ncbi:hypothetical protein [Amycolatopsis methanolica]|uniref:hypothetical protein n=1 Tax=Amycolatopsis methanolica TaxID=1814 RepID=UPI00343D2670